MKIDGGCHCGKIRYEAEVDPSKVVICHCTDCQTPSGSAFRTVVPNHEGSFRLLSGTPRNYIKTAESGGRRAQPNFNAKGVSLSADGHSSHACCRASGPQLPVRE